MSFFDCFDSDCDDEDGWGWEREEDASALPITSGGRHDERAQQCPGGPDGCAARWAALCACCGRQASVVTEAASDEAGQAHTVSYCTRCHAALLAMRPPSAAPLVYLLGAPEPAAEKRRGRRTQPQQGRLQLPATA